MTEAEDRRPRRRKQSGVLGAKRAGGGGLTTRSSEAAVTATVTGQFHGNGVGKRHKDRTEFPRGRVGELETREPRREGGEGRGPPGREVGWERVSERGGQDPRRADSGRRGRAGTGMYTHQPGSVSGRSTWIRGGGLPQTLESLQGAPRPQPHFLAMGSLCHDSRALPSLRQPPTARAWVPAGLARGTAWSRRVDVGVAQDHSHPLTARQCPADPGLPGPQASGLHMAMLGSERL